MTIYEMIDVLARSEDRIENRLYAIEKKMDTEVEE